MSKEMKDFWIIEGKNNYEGGKVVYFRCCDYDLFPQLKDGIYLFTYEEDVAKNYDYNSYDKAVGDLKKLKRRAIFDSLKIMRIQKIVEID